jgi:hypothetical protein
MDLRVNGREDVYWVNLVQVGSFIMFLLTR